MFLFIDASSLFISSKLSRLSFTSLQEVEEALERAVHFYNELRPHGSIGMLTPKEAAKQKGSLKKNWTSYREKYIKSLSVQEK